MSDNTPLNARWGVTDANEPLDPSLNNIDNESLATQEKERYKQDTRQRKFLAQWVVWVSSVWLGVVLIIIIMCGFQWLTLDVAVLNVLLATTTANVLGLAYIVLKGLFGHKTTDSLDCNIGG